MECLKMIKSIVVIFCFTGGSRYSEQWGCDLITRAQFQVNDFGYERKIEF